jgi:uncharacterized membrane protein YbhN (UPF0104 family)
MNRKIAISLLAGLALSAAALYLAFRRVPAAEILHYMSGINYWMIPPALALVLLSFVMRAVRWQIIVGSVKRISLSRAFHPLMIGFMINCVLPGRVGELARPMILRRNESVPFVTGLATVGAERVFDLIMLLGFFAVLLSTVTIDRRLSIEFAGYQLNRGMLETVFWGMAKVGGLLVAGIVAINIDWVRSRLLALLRQSPALMVFTGDNARAWVARRLVEPLVRLIERLAQGFLLLKNPRRLGVCLAVSAAIWLVQWLSCYALALGSPGIDLSYWQLSATMIIIMFFIALPSVPGYWGLWEAGGVFAMAIFGVPAREAAGFTLANHFIQVLPIMVVGVISAVIASVNIWQVSYGENRQQKAAP